MEAALAESWKWQPQASSWFGLSLPRLRFHDCCQVQFWVSESGCCKDRVQLFFLILRQSGYGRRSHPTRVSFREAHSWVTARVQLRQGGGGTFSDDGGECVFLQWEFQRAGQKCLSDSQLGPLGQGRGSPDQLRVKRSGWWLAGGPYNLGMDQKLQ